MPSLPAVAESIHDDFEPTPIKPGHFIGPELDTGDAAYDEIRDRWAPAAEGQDLEGFHGLVAANLDRAQAAGRYGEHGAGIGGKLFTAKVNVNSISVRQSYTFTETAVHRTTERAESEVGQKAPMRTASAGELLRRSLGNM